MANPGKTARETEAEQFQNEYTVATADPTLERGPYIDGFSSRTVIGAIFVAMIMMPGSVYLGLVAGQSLGSAAEWVTIILFAELARRSFAHLKRQEVYILFYVASTIAAMQFAQLALAGGPLALSIWNQYLLQSPQTAGLAEQIPDWVVPAADSPGILNRNLMHVDWWWSASKGFLSPIILIAFGYLFGRFVWFGLGYLLFRATSDGERLPFPLAAIAAQGATALAESTDREEGAELGKRSWRWRVFSVGASFGILFGAVYVLLPVTTGLFMSKPIMLLPIPFVDFTRTAEGIFPASLISISFDMAILMAGMILPFRLVLGIFSSIAVTNLIANPILQKMGFFPHWSPGGALLVNQMILSFDFWMSAAIGLASAVALVGVFNMLRTLGRRLRMPREALEQMRQAEDAAHSTDPNEPPYRRPSKQRGDFPIWVALFFFILGTTGFCIVSLKLVPGFTWWIIFLFGFLWSPLNSFISARLVGLTGQPLVLPFLKETVFITSGYKKADIWFAPIPLFDMGPVAQKFRELELTRTKFSSLVKAELAMFPIVFICSFLFWWFFWHLNQIPSDQFPFASRIWPVAARQAYLIFTANNPAPGETSLLLQAIKPSLIIGGCGAGVVLYGALAFFNLPVIFFYGIVGGVGQPLHVGLPLIAGALLSRYFFARKFGVECWNRYVPVVAAGFSCGMGLAGMTAVALALIAQCTHTLPF